MLQTGGTAGKYTLGPKLGEGSFGLVFVARDTGLDRDVALKFLHPHHTANPQVLERFLQEARSAARLSHPGIVTVFELGTMPEATGGPGGVTFIAMELLRGESLRARLARRGRLSTDAAVDTGRQIASALHVAHAAGVIHRDLKPDNVFLAADPATPSHERIKVLDFGMAKLVHAGPSSVQTGSMVLGTPRYMSPEQCRSSTHVDHRSDIYALGCVLYELITGRPAFDGEPGEVLAKHQLVPAPATSALVADVPRELDELIGRMLAKDPGDRPQTMAEVEQRLAAELRRQQRSPAEVLPRVAVPVVLDLDGASTLRVGSGSMRAVARVSRSSWMLGAGLTLVGGVIALAVARRGPDRTAPAAPPVAAASSGREAPSGRRR